MLLSSERRKSAMYCCAASKETITRTSDFIVVKNP